MLRNVMEPLLHSLQAPLRSPLRSINELPRAGLQGQAPVGNELTLGADLLSLDADTLTLE